ncbi:thioredoxin fold domain-containing protein [Arcobacter sp. YIC-464]|uniref:thioredoxin family protein n=1 Tax=Arcobacter sp. YIC-464 TaxID=3376631 RepID=UPI003C1ADDC3
MRILLAFLFIINILNADYIKGKEIFDTKCASCHKGYISFSKLKENYFQRNNELLNLEVPTVNMLAWAIMESSRKIGDPNDPEMRVIEIEEYLKEYLSNPDINNSICDVHVRKYYKKKEPMSISDEEATNLAFYFMEYKKNRLKNTPSAVKILDKKYDEKELIKEAQEQGKHFIVYATSQSCYFCKKMKREVLDLDEIQEKINEDYIFIEVDVDFVKLPFDLKKKFKGMTPTFFILTQDGKLLNIYPGAWVKKDFIEILKENL